MSKELKSKNFTVTIEHDEFAESPREWDNLAIFAVSKGKYSHLGDIVRNFSGYAHPEVKSLIKEFGELAVIQPLYVYDHGGISLSTAATCAWDSSHIGYVILTKAAMRKVIAGKRITKALITNKAEAILTLEIEIYNQYLAGEVYNLELIGNDKPDITLDAAGGYFGYEYARSEAQEWLDNAELKLNEFKANDYVAFGLERMEELFKLILTPSAQPQLNLFGV